MRFDNSTRNADEGMKAEVLDVEEKCNQGFELHNEKKYREALEVFEEVLRIDPEYVNALFGKGAALSNLKEYEEALKFLDKVPDKNDKHFIAWNYKGYDLFNLGRYKEAIEAFNKIPEDNPEYVNALYGKGITFFVPGDLRKAGEEIENALKINEGNVPALILKGRIEIEKKEYESAIKSFEKAIHFDLDNPNPRLWSIYAEYLKLEFESDIEDRECREYREGITAIIRKLEEINKLSENNKELKLYILHFLGYFYYKSGDSITAKEKLEETLRLKPKSPLEERASELLDYIWTYKIRPIWWRWWLSSPIHKKRRVITFYIFLALIFLLPFFHPFIHALLPCSKVNWSIYTILIAFLILILLSPSIQSFKTVGLEVELLPPPSEPKLSPSSIIEAISSKKQKAGEKS